MTITDKVTGDDEEAIQGAGVLDANWIEECSPGVTLSIVALPEMTDENSDKCSVIMAHGAGQRLHLSRLEPLRMRALKGCKDIRAILDQAVRNHLETFSVHTNLEK